MNDIPNSNGEGRASEAAIRRFSPGKPAVLPRSVFNSLCSITYFLSDPGALSSYMRAFPEISDGFAVV